MKEEDFRVSFYASATSCGMAEVGGFSNCISIWEGFGDDTKERRDMVEGVVRAMTSWKIGDKRNVYLSKSGVSYGRATSHFTKSYEPHIVAIWNESSATSESTQYFIEMLEKYGWIVVKGGQPPHGGDHMMLAISAPDARHKAQKEFGLIPEKKKEEKCNSTEKNTPK